MREPSVWQDDPRFKKPEFAYKPDMSTAQPTPRLRWVCRETPPNSDRAYGYVLQQEYVAYGRDEYGSAVPASEWRDVPCEEDEP